MALNNSGELEERERERERARARKGEGGEEGGRGRGRGEQAETLFRDNNTDTYWQSDGPQPHLVNIQFHKKVEERAEGGRLKCLQVSIKEIAMYCDFKLDESYTPSKISYKNISVTLFLI